MLEFQTLTLRHYPGYSFRSFSSKSASLVGERSQRSRTVVQSREP